MTFPAISATVSLTLPPFADLAWEAEVDFLLGDIPFGLLGYEGFLNRWVIIVNGYHSWVIVESLEDFEERLPPDPAEEYEKRDLGWKGT